MSFRSFIKKAHGFSLMEVIIAAGLMSGLAVAIVQMIESGNKGAKRVAQDIEVAALSADIVQALSDKRSCQRTLNGVNLTTAAAANYSSGASITSIQKFIGNSATTVRIIEENKSYSVGNSRVTIPTGGIKIFKYDGANPGSAKISVTFKRTQGASNTAVIGTDIVKEYSIYMSDLDTNGIFNEATDSCFADESFYQDAACSSIGGVLDNATGRCRSLTLFEDQPGGADSPTNTASGGRAVTVFGDISMFNSGGDTAKLYIEGLAEIGNSTVAASTSDILTVSGRTNFRENVTLSGGNLSVASGNLAVSGTSTLTGATSVGNTLAVTGATTLSSTLAVGSNTTVGGTLGVTGATTLSNTLGVTGATTLNSTLTVAGVSTFNNNVSLNGDTTSAGFITINKTVGELGGPNVNPRYVPTKEWVLNMVTGLQADQLTTAQKDAIVNYVLNMNQNTAYNTLRDSIMNYTLQQIAPASFSCPANQAINAVSYNSANGDFSYTCGGSASVDCRVDGNCNQLYATTKFCLPGENCLTSGKTAFWGACSWAANFGINYALDGSTGLRHWFCPNNYFAAGNRFRTFNPGNVCFRTYSCGYSTCSDYNGPCPDQYFSEPWCCPAKLMR